MPMPVAADPSQPPIFRISNVRLIASIMLEHLVWLVPAVALMVGAAVIAAIMDGESPFLIFMALLRCRELQNHPQRSGRRDPALRFHRHAHSERDG